MRTTVHWLGDLAEHNAGADLGDAIGQAHHRNAVIRGSFRRVRGSAHSVIVNCAGGRIAGGPVLFMSFAALAFHSLAMR